MSNPKCIRIEYEYEDGSLYRAEGDDAEQISRAQRASAVMDWLHGNVYNGPQMKLMREPQPAAQGEHDGR